MKTIFREAIWAIRAETGRMVTPTIWPQRMNVCRVIQGITVTEWGSQVCHRKNLPTFVTLVWHNVFWF